MAKKQSKANKRNHLTLVLLAAVIVVLAVGVSILNRPRAEKLVPGTVLTLPLSGITEEASFYSVTVDGTQMEVLAIRTASGEVRTAFNTCQSCYTSGHGYYKANGTGLICQNCGFHFDAEEVGVETGGGCNPWPITAENRSETADSIEISYETLAGARQIFSNWSKG